MSYLRYWIHLALVFRFLRGKFHTHYILYNNPTRSTRKNLSSTLILHLFLLESDMLIDLHKDNIPHSCNRIPMHCSDTVKSLDHPRSYSRVHLSYILAQVLEINFRSGDQIPRLGLNVQALLICNGPMLNCR